MATIENAAILQAELSGKLWTYLTGLPPARRASSLVAVSDSEIAIVAFTPKPKGNTISTGEEKCDSERCVRN